MKRANYVDQQGNVIDQSFESKKPILVVLFIIGTIVPLLLIGFIIYTAIQNNNCNNIYNEIKKSTNNYLKEESLLPSVEGEYTSTTLDKLYENNYLSSFKTNNMVCKGTVKTTKTNNKYVYSINLSNCNTCTTSKRYKGWSDEVSNPSNKPIIDVIPYYNYYEREINITDWSKYYEKEELAKENSKYGIKLPANPEDNGMPEVPEEGQIVEAKKEEILNYRHKDKQWLWYDIIGDYSEFTSEKPSGYSQKDEKSRIYSNWSKWSLNHPQEKSYRDISTSTGYQFYYEKDGKKVYANNKKYTVAEDVDQTKYNKRESKSVKMYRYRDTKWRWYNGQKRKYSTLKSEKPNGYNYRDDETESETNYSSWEEESSLTDSNSSYRTEETKVLTRFCYVYEILSDPVLEEPVTKDEFIDIVGMSVPEFVTQENYKMEVTYQYKYRKR